MSLPCGRQHQHSRYDISDEGERAHTADGPL